MTDAATPPAYRNVLIIGGTSGLGQAVAREFAPLAKEIHLTYHGQADEADEVVAGLGPTATAHQVTLPDPDLAGARVRRLLADVTPCDVVVNCAVSTRPAVATISNVEVFRSAIDANVIGAYQVNAVSAQAMAATGGGCVINISSILTRRYVVGALGYITSKAALETMTRGFAKEWGALGLRFLTVSPGPIRDTKLLAQVPPEVVERVMGTPDYVERLMAPEKVAAVIRQLAGPDFAALNGDVVTVDEGLSL